IDQREPLSGQRALSARVRATTFPLAPGFGCEVRMTIDAARAGLRVEEVTLPLRHRPTGRDLAGCAHRARQLAGTVLAAGPPALKAYLAVGVTVDATLGIGDLLLPYDLREMAMLGNAGANSLGALLGLNSVERLTGTGRWIAIGALAGLTILGERTSLGALIERTPGLAQLDRLGRRA